MQYGGLAGFLEANPGNFLAAAGIALVLSGVAFKIGAFPFQIWVPDVYQGAPTPVTALLAVASKAAGFIVLLVLVTEVFGAVRLAGRARAHVHGRGHDPVRQPGGAEAEQRQAPDRPLGRLPRGLHPSGRRLRRRVRRWRSAPCTSTFRLPDRLVRRVRGDDGPGGARRHGAGARGLRGPCQGRARSSPGSSRAASDRSRASRPSRGSWRSSSSSSRRSGPGTTGCSWSRSPASSSRSTITSGGSARPISATRPPCRPRRAERARAGAGLALAHRPRGAHGGLGRPRILPGAARRLGVRALRCPAPAPGVRTGARRGRPRAVSASGPRARPRLPPRRSQCPASQPAPGWKWGWRS